MTIHKFTHSYARASAPASVSNVGPGFDVFGFAINGIGDEVEAWPHNKKEVLIIGISGNNGISLDPEQNTAGKAVLALLSQLKIEEGVKLFIHKRIPTGSGIGSSASSAVAAVVAVNALLENPLPKEELVQAALAGEAIASGGSIHGDNVLPCLLGGFVIIKDVEQNKFCHITISSTLRFVVLHPDIEIKTSYARSILPKELPIKSVVSQVANASYLVAGLLLGNSELIREGVHDLIAEPYRKNLIPGYDAVKEIALANGALGYNISGSGPSVFAIFDSQELAEKTAELMEVPFLNQKLTVDRMVTSVNNEGAKVLELE
jgi:homoserine kinase